MKTTKNFILSIGVVGLILIAGTQAYAGNEVLPPCVSGQPTAVNGSRCGTGSVTIGAVSTPSGFFLRWYDASGTSVLYTSDGDLTWSTPSISSTTNYMVAYYRPSDGCTSTKTTVTATVSSAPSSDAGSDQTSAATCGLTTVTLAASPSGGTWSVVSGSGGSFGNSSSNTSTFSGTAGATYTLRWSVTSGGCTGTDDVVVTFNQNPTSPNAGSDQTVCASSVALSGNTPSIGSGQWTIAVDTNPGGSISPSTSPGGTLSGAYGTYGVRWTITNGACSLMDEAMITLASGPTISNAGADQTGSSTCGSTSVTLAANSPSVGTGSWSVVSGSGGSFGNSASPTSTFSGTAGSTYTLRWTITTANCGSSTDDMFVTLNRVPTTSNAGADQTGSATCGLSAVTLAANTPSVGTGSWSVVSGVSGSFGNSSSATSTFSGTIGSTYTLRWTITNSPCTASTDDMVVTFTPAPTPANAGADISVCGLTSVNLAATTVDSGTGTWSIVSGSGGSVASANNPGSSFSGVAGTTYTLQWTSSLSPCTSSSDQVTVALKTNPTSNAGADQTGAATCGLTSTTLAANNPSPGTGAWTVVTGSGGSFGNSTSATSTFSGTAGVTYTLRWTVTNNGCTGTDDVDIKFNQNPTTPNAGVDQSSACGATTAMLAGNTPGVGTGHWSLAVDSSPGGSFSNASISNPTLTGTSGGIYGVIWTITNGVCVLSDEAMMTFNQNPTVSNAGPDQTDVSTCGLTSLTLAANTATIGTGTWSVVSGTGCSFENSASPTSTFTGTAGSTYTLRWTITRMACTSVDDVVIKFNSNVTTANAGPDQISAVTCGLTSVTLAANTPTVGTGAWTLSSGAGGSFGNSVLANSTFTGTLDVTYTLRWTITNSPCTGSYDELYVKINKAPTVSVSPSTQTIGSGQTTSIIVTNPNGASGTTFIWTTNPANATLIDMSTSPTISGRYYNADGFNDGTVTYNVFANSSICASTSYATATVTIQNIPDAPAPTPPLVYDSIPARFIAYAPEGCVTHWYDSAAAPTPFATGDVYVNTLIHDSLTYYVSFKNSTTNRESAKVGVTGIKVGTISPASIVEETIRVPNKITDADVNLLSLDTARSVTVTYADGLSRATQVIAIKASPGGKDMVAPAEFDSYGRTSKKYLPYTKTITHTDDPVTGVPMPGFQSTFKTDQAGFYTTSNDKIANDNAPYAQTIFEISPLGRPLEQGRVGQTWQPGTSHTSKMQYSFNKASDGDDVRIFNTTFTVGSAVTTSSYADNTLNRTRIIDGNRHHEIVFTDLAGRTLMRKKQLDGTINSTSVDYLRTAYVYDEMGRLSYIIPPGGYAALQANSWVLTQAVLDGHLYQFVYDNRGRVTKKKTPGQDWIYMGYDKLNRVVLVQDGNTRPTNKWAFVKYDIQGRAVMTGFYTNTTQTTLSAMQAILDGLYSSGAWYETKGSALEGYTNQSFPTQNADATPVEVMTVNYFDDYDFDNNTTADYTYDAAPLSGTTRNYAVGFPTGSKRKILGKNSWLKNAMFYDIQGRVIQSQGNNYLNTAAVDKSSVSYDFEGKTTKTATYHNPGSNAVNVQLIPKYDNAGRTMYLKHNINSAGYKKVVNYQVNELGQVVMKQLHNVGGSAYMQNVDYRYNINGLLTSINNAQLASDSDVTNGDANDYFGMEMLYDVYDSGIGNDTTFNGNLSGVKWKSYGTTGLKGASSYKFSYDKTDKLLSAAFKRYNTSWDANVNALNETMTYDHNGNILTLQRNRENFPTGASESMDALTYTYANGNFLSKVEDSSGVTTGFNNGSNTTTEYTYDAVGNLTADANKGISSITYNLLGKPQQITMSDGRTIVYTYDAAGTKLKMLLNVSGDTTATDYVNGFVYNNRVLDFFGSPEGRVKKNGSSFEYQYSITDHQGNTRILFTSASPTAQSVTATFESAAQLTEAGQFTNYPSSSGINPVASNNHTPGGTNSQYLHAGLNGQVGVSKSYAVLPGDQVQIEAYARYTASSGSSNLANFAAALLSAFQLSAPGVGEMGTASSAINNWGAMAAGGYGDGSTDSSNPKAFVNILIFDKNYNLLDLAYSQVTSSGSPGYLSASYTIKEPGYAYVYISNENPTLVNVYFDDVKMTYIPGNVIQSNEYYPFGLLTGNSWTRDANKNNFLYNEGSELNTTSGLYDLPYRNYDAALGRFFQVDPMASRDHTLSPFVYGGDNPVNLNDPSGLMVDYMTSTGNPDYLAQLQWQAMEAQNNALAMSMWARSSGAWDIGTPRGGAASPGQVQLLADAAAVKSGRMSIQEYAKKYGTSISKADGYTFSISTIYEQADLEQSRRSSSASVGEVSGVQQGTAETPREINRRFGDSFDFEFGALKMIPDVGMRQVTLEKFIKTLISDDLGMRILLDKEDEYAMRPIYYEMSGGNGGQRVNIVPRSQWTSDPVWGNPGTIRPGGGPTGTPTPILILQSSTSSASLLTIYFQKIPDPEPIILF